MKVAKSSNTSPANVGLQDLERSNDNVQARCSRYLRRVTTRLERSFRTDGIACLKLLQPSLLQKKYETNLREQVEKATHAIQTDDTSMLEIALEHTAGKQALDQEDGHAFSEMLFVCIILQSRSCLEYLLRYTHLFSENNRHLAQSIIKLGRINSAKLCCRQSIEDLMPP